MLPRPLARPFAFGAWIVLALALASTYPAHAQVVDRDFWGPQGGLQSMALHGDSLFVLGGGAWFAPPTGGFVSLDSSDAALRPGGALVKGVIRACLSDGAGGWYVGGSYMSVNGVSRAGLAHVLADGTLDGWNPGANNVVNTLAWLDANTLLVGGGFTSLAGQSVRGLAAVDAHTGAAVAWGPAPLADGEVYAIARSGSVVYVGGYFNGIAGVTRHHLAAFSAATGAVLSWAPEPNAAVYAIQPGPGKVYVGGDFGQMRTTSVSGFVAVDSVTAMPTVLAPPSVIRVNAIAQAGNVFYLGMMNGLASVDLTSNVVTIGPYGETYQTLAIAGPWLYEAGHYGLSRRPITAAGAGAPIDTTWAPRLDGWVLTLGSSGGHPWMGGDFSSVGGMSTGASLVAMDLATGRPTAWRPQQLTGTIAWVADGDSVLYVGGRFKIGADSTYRYVAALDPATGVPRPWRAEYPAAIDIQVYPTGVTNFAVHGNLVFVNHVILGSVLTYAVDRTTGALVEWPYGPASFQDIVFTGGTGFVCGGFGTLGGATRNGVAAFDATTLATTAWDAQLNPNASVYALAVGGSTLYAGGYFLTASGNERTKLAAFDASTAQLQPWNPGTNATVRALAVGPGAVYAGGDFTSVNGIERSGLAALDPVTGAVMSWNPNLRVKTARMAIRGDRLFVANTGDMDGNANHGLFAVSIASSGAPPTAHVLAPHAGDTLAVGSVADLAWSATAGVPGVQRIDLELSRSGRSGPFATLASGIANTGHHAWTVTGPASNDCWLRVVATDYAGGTAADTSAAAFAIAPTAQPTVIVSFAAAVSVGGVHLGWRISGPQTADAAVVQRRADGDPNGWAPVTAARTCAPDSCVMLDSSVDAGRWWYRVAITDTHGALLTSPQVLVDLSPSSPPAAFELALVGANPNDGSGTVTFAVPSRAVVRVTLVDLQGRTVAVLADGVHDPGRYSIPLAAHVRRSGLYFLRMSGGGHDFTRRIVVVK